MKPTDQQIQEMYEWYQQRQTQQLSYPVDDASRNALRVVEVVGTSNHATTVNTPISVSIVTGSGNVTLPVAPAGFIVIGAEGAQYTIPYYT